ncbi:Isonitrile hydratase [Sporomusa ovata DSM 2662]|uniref:ThiJ/PfpI family protein n=1 Tax=Sporomusa ovata TaxID=2378 RepID=A0A0U1L7V7_9FIRM|nr:DJ-1/PfpI family protein [Sporomusa ovata]EQB24594.1 transcriptional regulator, AraC family [Sporomusa ovata DSM 2662]CQR74954.1 ThiJ/PfpI family protein [Sporomusa ovata]
MNNVGIFLFNDIELLDFAGPYEVFSVTSELNEYQFFKVFTISSDGYEIKSVNGLRVVPDFSFANHPPIDILVIPGGVGTRAEINKREVLDWINKTSKNSQITMSVCSGARILGILGFLDHLESTTHHEVVEHLKEIAPNTIISQGKRFIDNKNIMTAGGISAGIDLSLHIVKKIQGEAIVNKTIRYMEYGDWQSL